MMYPDIKSYCEELVKDFRKIPEDRKKLLDRIAEYVNSKLSKKEGISLVYICTHNSRRSHFGQVWAKVASEYYNVPNVKTYSGGTEATAFNSNAIKALERVGFKIKAVSHDKNSVYQVQYDDKSTPIECFSKVYDHPKNPQGNFGAIMTCGEAEENCPFIPGAELRISTIYEDPKAFDGKSGQDAVYDERCKQIARETLYAFSRVLK